MELSTAMSKGAISPYAFAGMYHKLPAKLIYPMDIIRLVCADYMVELEQLQRHTRRRKIVLPRQVCMYMVRWHFKASESLKSIGQLFGNLDHTTVIHSIRTVENLMDTEPEFKERIERIKALVAKLQIDN